MTPRLVAVAAASACLAADAIRKRTATTPRAETSFGDVIGLRDGGQCDGFLGIPFAEAPVRDLRFEKAVPWQGSYPPEGYNAQTFGAKCIQAWTAGAMDAGSEDCLFLNIWRPRGVAADAKLPVMVWLHGGAFIMGDGGNAKYHGCNLAHGQDVIVVTVNYRMSIFGFGTFETEDGTIDTNFGLEDQRESLRWLRREVAAFGGDPERITLFGESAGGISVWHHMVAVPSAGLFAGAIVQSGFPAGKETAVAVAQTRAMGARLGCHNPSTLKACLRSKSPNEIQQKDDGHNPLRPDIQMLQRWQPVQDGVELPDHPLKLLKDGKSHPVPIIHGSMTDEGTFFTYLMYPIPLANTPYRNLITRVWNNNPSNPSQNFNSAEVGQVLRSYPAGNSFFADNRRTASEVSGDSMFDCATRLAAQLHHQRAPAWTFRFNHRPPGACLELFQRPIPGVFHAIEIEYVFNTFKGCQPDQTVQGLTKRIQDYWGNFARTQDPNNGTHSRHWPRYTPSDRSEIVFQGTDAIEQNFKANACGLWNDLLYSKVL